MTGDRCARSARSRSGRRWPRSASRSAHVPPFLLTGLALVVGSVPSWPLARQWRVPRVDAAARRLRPVRLPLPALRRAAHARRRSRPISSTTSGRSSSSCSRRCSCRASRCGRCTSARRSPASPARRWRSSAAAASSGGLAWGYLAAAGSAFIWASYSLLTRRVAHFPTAAIGLFGLVSGCSRSPATRCSSRRSRCRRATALLIALIGLGPLGAAFFLWDAALKRGDPRRIGLLSYLTPLASTLLLALTTGRPLTPWIGAAALLIVGAAIVGVRAR